MCHVLIVVYDERFKYVPGCIISCRIRNDGVSGDIVIRHWINGKGVEIARKKNIACLITLNPTKDALEMAQKIKFPVIVVEKIQFDYLKLVYNLFLF